MRTRQLLTIAVAALFLIGGATAIGAATPAEQASDNAGVERTPDNAKETADRPASVGPSDGLPEQVPDRVSTILETITSFQNGGLDDLGETLSSLLGGGPSENAGESGA